MDVVAEILSDLVCSICDGDGKRSPNTGKTSYYHIVNPCGIQYSNFVTVLAERVGPQCLEIVSLQKWVDLLAEQVHVPMPELDFGFFQGLPKCQDPVILSSVFAEKISPRLAALGPIREEWLNMWLDQWALARS